MRFAVPTDRTFVSAHFGRCPIFTIVDVENSEITRKEIVENPGHQPGFIPEFLHKRGVECVVTGGMGLRAEGMFTQAGIRTIVGVSGPVDEVINNIVEGILEGGESLCRPGAGKGYGLDKTECTHSEKENSDK